MKKILLITEKRSITESLLSEIMNENDEMFVGAEIWVCNLNYGSAPIYEYPKDVKYKEYPKTNDLKLKWNPNFSVMNKDKGNFNFDNLLVKQATKRGDFNQHFDALILCQDCDYAGAFFASSFLELVYGDDYEGNFGKVFYLEYFNMSEIYKGFYDNQKEKRERFITRSNAGKFLKFFQYNFNFNSSMFLSEILVKLNIKTDINISKYELQLIHILFDDKKIEKFMVGKNKELTDINILELMTNYIGSGKYKDIYNGGIGGVATRMKIVKNMFERGFLKREGKVLLRTKLGYDFFKLLNKRTFDIDLPFRVNSWVREVEEGKDNYGKVEKYIYNFFVEQKRKNRKM